jgi:hypothetical protein
MGPPDDTTLRDDERTCDQKRLAKHLVTFHIGVRKVSPGAYVCYLCGESSGDVPPGARKAHAWT